MIQLQNFYRRLSVFFTRERRKHLANVLLTLAALLIVFTWDVFPHPVSPWKAWPVIIALLILSVAVVKDDGTGDKQK